MLQKIMEIVYDWNPTLLLAIGLLIDIVLYAVERPKKLFSLKSLAIALVIVFSLFGMAFVQYIQREYTKVPDVDDRMILFTAIQTITGSELKCEPDLGSNYANYDESARAQYMAGNDITASSHFKVTQVEPAPGKLVPKGTTVSIWLTWSDINRAVAVDESEGNHFDPEEYYGSVKAEYLYPFNADSFSLAISKAALHVSIGNQFTYELGVYAQDALPVSVSLVNYETGKVIETKNAFVGDTVEFANLPDGTYYYRVDCEGFKTYVPESPFLLQRDPAKEADVLPWAITLEESGKNYGQSFRVQVLDQYGDPVANADASIRGQYQDAPDFDGGFMLDMKTDENGYLMGMFNLDYKVASFQLMDGYVLQVSGDDGEYVTAHQESSDLYVVNITASS